jgi:hypothetical protein
VSESVAVIAAAGLKARTREAKPAFSEKTMLKQELLDLDLVQSNRIKV